MGKKQHRKIKVLNTNTDEKQRIREKVLNVFRARINSPDGGPAILVKDPPTVEGNLPIAVSSVIDSDESYGERMDPMSAHQRKRCQKTRGERNKKRCQKPQISYVKDDVWKHVKTVHLVSLPKSNSPTSDDRSFSMITQNRITRRLGLFNCGKKSGKVFRVDPLIVPEAVAKRTQAELHKIVSHSDIEDDSPDETDEPATPLQDSCMKTQIHHSLAEDGNQQSIKHHMSIRRPALNTPGGRSSCSLSSAFTDVSTRSSINEEDESLPSIPPYESFEISLLQNLQSLKAYERRDLVQETFSCLKEVFKNSLETELHTPNQGQLLLETCPRNDATSCSSITCGQTQKVPSLPRSARGDGEHETSSALHTKLTVDVSSTLQSCEDLLQTDIKVASLPPRHGPFGQVDLLDDARGLLLQDCLAVENGALDVATHRSNSTVCMHSASAAVSCNNSHCLSGAVQHADCSVRQRPRPGLAENRGFQDEMGFPHPRALAPRVTSVSSERSASGCCAAGLSPLAPFSLHCQQQDLMHARHTRDGASATSRHSTSHMDSGVMSDYIPQFHDDHYRDIPNLPSSAVEATLTASDLDTFEIETDDAELKYLEQSYCQAAEERCIALPGLYHPASPMRKKPFSQYNSRTRMSTREPPSQSPSPPKLYPRRLY